jgi:hypothetical protein
VAPSIKQETVSPQLYPLAISRFNPHFTMGPNLIRILPPLDIHSVPIPGRTTALLVLCRPLVQTRIQVLFRSLIRIQVLFRPLVQNLVQNPIQSLLRPQYGKTPRQAITARDEATAKLYAPLQTPHVAPLPFRLR